MTSSKCCNLQNNYNHYSVVGIPIKSKIINYNYVNIFYTSSDIRTSQEVFLYPFDSLLSEFGGALSLFLGFSFLGLLDIIQTGCSNLMTRLNFNIAFTLPDV